MKNIISVIIVAALLPTVSTAQHNPTENHKVVLITGARFAYPLLQKWIDDYSTVNPDVQILIESRGTVDPSKYDILIEAYEHSDEIKRNREYIYIARYAIVPVANSYSDFAKTYGDKGLTKEIIRQLFFHDIYADIETLTIKDTYTVYTRLQKAGAPTVFAKHFGYEQKDVKGKAIAGADEHLLKALLRDSTGVSYLPLSVVYDRISRKPLDGITILPVDINGNGRLNEDEKFYGDLSAVTKNLTNKSARDINNIPIAYLHFSVDKATASPEAVEFLRWIVRNGQDDLEAFGYLAPESHRFEKEKFEQFASKRN